MRGRIFAKQSSGPVRGFIITTGEEVSGRHCGLHSGDAATERAQAHGPLKMFDSHVGLTSPNLRPPEEEPCRRKVRIEHERPLNCGNSRFEVVDNKRKHIAARCERHCVVFSCLYGSSSEPCSLLDLSHRIARPAKGLSLRIAQGRHALSRSEIWVEFDRAIEQP